MDRPLNLLLLAELLFMSYGFTHKTEYGREVYLYRAAPSAGALYPVEVYVLAADIDGLEDGLYHYSLMDFELTRLRQGPPPPGLPAPSLALTGLFFRSVWKYRDRALRYCLLDTGHLAENLSLAGSALRLESEFLADFDDDALNEYLGLDREKEAALGLFRLGRRQEASQEASTNQGPAPIELPEALPVAPRETSSPLISEAMSLTSAPCRDEVVEAARPMGEEFNLPYPLWSEFEGPTLVKALQSRRSRRNFRAATLLQRDLRRALEMILPRGADRYVDLGLVINEIQDIPDGYYRLTGDEYKIIRHRGGFMSPSLADAALSQDWVGRANINLVFSARLGAMEERLGPRALRLAYLTAGRIGQRAYLAAEAMGWGACGIGAFFDRDVSRLLGLDPGEDPLYLLPLGPVKKRTHGGRPTKA